MRLAGRGPRGVVTQGNEEESHRGHGGLIPGTAVSIIPPFSDGAHGRAQEKRNWRRATRRGRGKLGRVAHACHAVSLFDM
eukprot:7262994-Pyramimonas_sp.AAC.1